jgi:hypothetical protein
VINGLISSFLAAWNERFVLLAGEKCLEAAFIRVIPVVSSAKLHVEREKSLECDKYMTVFSGV